MTMRCSVMFRDSSRSTGRLQILTNTRKQLPETQEKILKKHKNTLRKDLLLSVLSELERRAS